MSLPVDVPITNLLEERATFQRQQPKWQGIAKDVAEEFSCPISEVEQLLSTEGHQLEQGAHIKEFIPTLARHRPWGGAWPLVGRNKRNVVGTGLRECRLPLKLRRDRIERGPRRQSANLVGHGRIGF